MMNQQQKEFDEILDYGLEEIQSLLIDVDDRLFSFLDKWRLADRKRRKRLFESDLQWSMTTWFKIHHLIGWMSSGPIKRLWDIRNDMPINAHPISHPSEPEPESQDSES